MSDFSFSQKLAPLPKALSVFQRLNRSLLLATAVLVADQWTKKAHGRVNSGISFSWFSGYSDQGVALMVTLLLILIAVLGGRWFWKTRLAWWGFIIFLAAGASNVVDRWRFGGVRDIWSVPFLRIENNLADWLIFCALLGMMIALWKEQNNHV